MVERALSVDLEQVKLLLDHAPDAVYWLREDGHFVYVNQTACHALGYTRDQLLNLPIWEVDADLTPARWAEIWRKSPAEDRFERRHRRRDGRVFAVDVRMRHIEHRGEWLHFSFVRDLTTFHQQERLQRDYQGSVSSLLAANDELERYRDLVERLPIGIFRSQLEGNGLILAANPAMARILDAESTEGLLGQEPVVFYASADERRRLRERVLAQGSVARLTIPMVTMTGRRIWAAMTARVVQSSDGQSILEGSLEDISDERHSQYRARQAQAILEAAGEGVTVADAEGNIEWVNPAFERVTGYCLEEVLGRNPRLLSSGEQSPSFYKDMWASIERNGFWQGEIRNRRKSGEVYPEWLSINAIRDESGQIVNYAGVFTDLSRLKRSQSELEHLRRFDSLTGLPNRRSLESMLGVALERARVKQQPLAVMVVGLDRFRMINESYSYHIGDQVLCEFADRLRTLSGPHVDVARARGDQFVVTVNLGATLADIDDWLARLRELASEPIELPDQLSLAIKFTIGISRFPDDGATPTELLRNAEAAMFLAKKHHPGGHASYAPEQARVTQQRLQLEVELARAIRDDALEVALQPILRVADDRVVGAEALARWSHSEKGPIAPDVFIPLAEEVGMIGPLSVNLLRKAASAFGAGQWPDRLFLAFNISVLQLSSPEFRKQVLDCLEQVGMRPERVELELTESVLMSSSTAISELLNDLTASGLSISIDDFGTGYSSLAYLQEIRAQTLKIDRRFIDAMDSETGLRIVSSIIAMAHALKMNVIAEGVETVDQRDALKRLDCDYYQGYLFSRPLSAREFARQYSDWQA